MIVEEPDESIGDESATGASENPEQPAHPSAPPATAGGERDNDYTTVD